MHLTGQTSIETVLIFAVMLTIVLIFAVTYKELLEKTSSFMAKKQAEYYKKKIENIYSVVCELGQGSALKIELGNAILKQNKIIVGDSEVELVDEKNSCVVEYNNFDITKNVWVIKNGKASLGLVADTASE